jgi:gliding motility-associated-like protein
VIESFPKNTILLNVAALQNEGGAKLNWNALNGWPNGVSDYSILRKVDKQQALSPYETIADTFKMPPGPQVFYKVASEGFEQCWRVIANEKDGEFKSFSNAVCVKFLNPLEFYSLITPNGDNLNDKFEIRNLHLYPENELRISDRWGQELYKRTNYNNSDLWDGSGLDGDVFFYKFTITNTGQEFNGWVTVARK